MTSLPARRDPDLPRARPRRRQGGFSLIEVLGAVVILGLGLMSQVAGAVSEQRLAHEEEVRTQVQEVVRQFMERLRSDEDWPTLYGRLRNLQMLAAPGPAGSGPTFEDGRRGHPAELYMSTFSLPKSLESMRFLVDVPSALSADGSGPELREDVTDPLFGLPADLDGDGQIDAAAHDDDYLALPVVVSVLWTPPGEASRQLKVGTWLRGSR